MTTRATVIEAIAAIALTETERLNDTMTLAGDVSLDSLDVTELAIELEGRLSIEIPGNDEAAWRTVGDVVAYAERKVGGAA